MFSQDVINVLKNFKLINNSMLFKKGEMIQVISPTESMLAQVMIKQAVPAEFAIYDMHQFLIVLQMFTEEAKYTFSDTSVKIKEGRKSVTYGFCNPGIIKTPPYEDMDFPVENKTEFKLNIASFIKQATLLDLQDISFQVIDGKYSIMAYNKKNITSNRFVVDTGLETGVNATVSLEKLRLFDSEEYMVTIQEPGPLITFETVYNNLPITYYIAADEE